MKDKKKIIKQEEKASERDICEIDSQLNTSSVDERVIADDDEMLSHYLMSIKNRLIKC